jgi:hypothetical protein
MSKARQRREFLATQKYMNRCAMVTSGYQRLAWSWAKRGQRFYRQERSGTHMAYGWLPRQPHNLR